MVAKATKVMIMVFLGQRELLLRMIRILDLRGQIVSASTNIHNNDVNFNHIIEYTLSCTLEESDKDVLSVSRLRFGTIDEVINVGHLRLH